MGDEKQQGPSYNYARVFTWFQVSRALLAVLNGTMENVSAEISIPNNMSDSGAINPGTNTSGRWDSERDLIGNAEQTASYCGLRKRDVLPTYASWRKMCSDPECRVFRYMLGAGVVALLVQWGTTGAAILIAYNTPVAGLGCRSGAYLVYGLLGTAGWLFHVASMMLSHWAMLWYQKALSEDADIMFGAEDENPRKPIHEEAAPPLPNGHALGALPPNNHTHLATPTPNNANNGENVQTRRIYEPPLAHSVVCFLAVFTRALAKVTVVVNALWIIFCCSLLGLVNMYNNCWCNAIRGTSWVLLFKSAPDLKEAAQSNWGGGVALSILSSALGFLVFYLGSRSRS